MTAPLAPPPPGDPQKTSWWRRQLAYWQARGLRRPVLLRSLRASLVVGSLLTALNQGDYLLSGNYPPALWWKIPLTYLVPFLVATYGALGATAPPADRG